MLTALLPHSWPGGFLGLHDAPLFHQKEVLHGDTKVFPHRTRSCGAPPPCRDLQGSFSGVQLDVIGASVCSGCSQSSPPTTDQRPPDDSQLSRFSASTSHRKPWLRVSFSVFAAVSLMLGGNANNTLGLKRALTEDAVRGWSSCQSV